MDTKTKEALAKGINNNISALTNLNISDKDMTIALSNIKKEMEIYSIDESEYAKEKRNAFDEKMRSQQFELEEKKFKENSKNESTRVTLEEKKFEHQKTLDTDNLKHKNEQFEFEKERFKLEESKFEHQKYIDDENLQLNRDKLEQQTQSSDGNLELERDKFEHQVEVDNFNKELKLRELEYSHEEAMARINAEAVKNQKELEAIQLAEKKNARRDWTILVLKIAGGALMGGLSYLMWRGQMAYELNYNGITPSKANLNLESVKKTGGNILGI